MPFKIKLPFQDNPYNIYIGPGIFDDVAVLISPFINSKNNVIVCDENVNDIYKGSIKSIDLDNGQNIFKYIIKPGEKSKNFSTIIDLCNFFSKNNLERNSTVIAFGGGVVGDIAGFAASVFLRGINFIQIPTTLLAACDSSVGGKVGINLEDVKNQVGSFYQPKLVLIEPFFLETLPKREIISGLAEVIKTGLIGSKNLYNKTINNIDKLFDFSDGEFHSEIIRDCVKFKAKIVLEDEKESNLRRILNFGHTIGHGIEAAARDKNILHGEAVILGMICAVYLSEKFGELKDSSAEQIIDSLIYLNSENFLKDLSFEKVLKYIKRDKKLVDGRINFVLLNEIGMTEQSTKITFKDMGKAYHYTKDLLSN